MGRRDDLIAKYADDLRSKCGVTPDMDLLKKVTIGCGPSIYDADAGEVHWRRCDYRIEEAQRRIFEASLPEVLAHRLAVGI